MARAFALSEGTTHYLLDNSDLSCELAPCGCRISAPAGFTFGLVSVLFGTETYPVSLASVQLAIEWRTPVHLMRFLNDAYSRNVLRAVGPSYQFRHARLQDQLAAAASPRGPSAPAPASTVGSPTV